MPVTAQLPERPTIPEELHDAFLRVQAQLRESLASLDGRAARLAAEQRLRRTIAIALKLVTVAGAGVIALGVVQGSMVQMIAGAIPAVIALEWILANTTRLLAIAAAKSAYGRLRGSLLDRHNNFFVEVIRSRARDPSAAADTLIGACGNLRDTLAIKCHEIEDCLHHNDYEHLGRVSIGFGVQSEYCNTD